jgi:SAM-dependent methyltransferase
VTASRGAGGAPGSFYATPELAEHYDAEFVGRPDLPFYLALAQRLGARRVADIGAGTGLLCSLLVGQGHEVVGVEPEATMLELARRQPHASEVTWVHGTAQELPAGWADLVLMTGHVAQYFLDDAAWRAVLGSARRALLAGGHLAFETRNPAREEWRTWSSEEPRAAMGRTVRTAVERHGDLVTHTDVWSQGGRRWTTSETLRFPSWGAVEQGLAAAGLEVVETWGDWDGGPLRATSPEWIVLARAPGG